MAQTVFKVTILKRENKLFQAYYVHIYFFYLHLAYKQ